MSSGKRKSLISFDENKNKKIKEFFPQILSKEQNNPSRRSGLTNTKNETSCQPKSNPREDTTSPKKKIDVTFAQNMKNKNMKYILTHDEKDSLYKGLNTLDIVQKEIEARPGQEMLVRGIQGIQGYLNLGMPLHCFPEKSHIEISFFKTRSEQKEDNQMSGRQDHGSTECVKFYIHAVGKTARRIVQCRKLHKEGSKLYVFGFKGETIKDTLYKDGRFCSFVEEESWKLISNLDSIMESTQPVDELEGKLFQVEVERKANRNMRESSQNSEPEERNSKVLENYIVEEYPSLTQEREKITEYIKAEVEKRKNKKTSLFILHKRYFGKQTKNSTPVKAHKFLSHLCDSVGFLYWENNGNVGCATCFVFSGLFIITCRHVINDVVGRGIEPRLWAEIIGRCVKVVFNYEEILVTEENSFSLEPWFQISDVTLDYAVLKLKANGQPVPLGLRDQIAPLPLSGLVYIIGHPEGDSKRTDGCVLVPQGERTQKYMETVQAGEAAGFPFAHMFTQNSFQEIAHNPNTVTYHTDFYWGSSGSPVFDSNGKLVAMHAAGITCPYHHGVFNIIEFGSSMKSILSDMKQKDEVWYTEVCGDQPQDVEMLSLEY